MMKNLLFVIIFLIAFLYRFPQLQSPFWVDEFSSARNAMMYLTKGWQVFSDRTEYIEHHNVTQHALMALSFRMFGVSEWAARIPSVIIGSIVPIAVYLLARRVYDRNTAIAATLFSIFSYFEITWSRQARSYILLQLLILTTIWLYAGLVKKFTISGFILSIGVMALGVLTHTTFLLIVVGLGLHFIYLCFHWNFFTKEYLKKFLPFGIFFVSLAIVLLLFNNFFAAISAAVFQALENSPNNLWYYHSFLWREQTIVTFLAAVGLMLNVLKYNKGTFLVAVPIALYLFFLSFLFSPYVSRYLLPIWPLLLILAGFAISTIARALKPNFPVLIVLVVVGFIVVNGDTFVIKPKAYYSVNHDIREIALIDYDQVYDIILEKTGGDFSQTAIVDTWADRARWYVGYDNPNVYLFHYEDEMGTMNGLSKKLDYEMVDGEKYLPEFFDPRIRFVSQLSDLQKVFEKYQRGFIWIDDESMSPEITEYAKEKLKKEIYLDHFPLDDNPYSIWPGTLYSWGW